MVGLAREGLEWETECAVMVKWGKENGEGYQEALWKKEKKSLHLERVVSTGA